MIFFTCAYILSFDSKDTESGRFSGFLSSSLSMSSLVNWDTVDGNGAGSFSLIEFINPKVVFPEKGWANEDTSLYKIIPAAHISIFGLSGNSQTTSGAIYSGLI